MRRFVALSALAALAVIVAGCQVAPPAGTKGELVEGVQLRLAIAKKDWPPASPGELPNFEVQVLNQGNSTVAVNRGELYCASGEIDGVWYNQFCVVTGGGIGESVDIAPGSRSDVVRIDLNRNMVERNAPERFLKLRAGPHRVRVGATVDLFVKLQPDGKAGFVKKRKSLELISNSIEVDISGVSSTAAPVPPDATGPLPETKTPTSATGTPQVMVTGRVRDESGAPVAGANVQLAVTTYKAERTVKMAVITDGNGTFSASVPRESDVEITAAHPDFGPQWAGNPNGWPGYRTWGSVPSTPVDLVLRHGVVLRGRVVDADNGPFGMEAILLVPANGFSTPRIMEVSTDPDGRFEFERAFLSQFDLVPRSLDQWKPHEAGEYLRITEAPASWLATAQSGGSLDLRVERYRLVPVSIDVTALKTKSLQVWTRWGAGSSGKVMQPDESGTVQVMMEQGVEHELWALPYPGIGSSMTVPWTKGIRRNALVTPNGPMTLKMTDEGVSEIDQHFREGLPSR